MSNWERRCRGGVDNEAEKSRADPVDFGAFFLRASFHGELEIPWQLVITFLTFLELPGFAPD